MATSVSTQQNDVYLALLAGRAVTGLANLADRPQAWDHSIEEDIRQGVAFCDAISSSVVERVPLPEQGDRAEAGAAINRLIAQLTPAKPLVSANEVDRARRHLVALLSPARTVAVEEIAATINFFLKATSGHSLRV